MPRVTTWNVNGLRAALRKGYGEHIATLGSDVLLLQEVRALPEQLPGEWQAPADWNVHWHPAEKKGYSGVATWTRGPHELIGRGLDGAADPEGRVLQTRAHGLRLVNVYLPSGSSGAERQAEKERWMVDFMTFAARLAALEEPVVLVGDLNIAHTEDDIWNPGGNKNNSGFLPHERAWFSELLGAGWTDTLRAHFGSGKGPYTWWSTRGQAREKDRGWRIDYVLCNAAAAARVRDVRVDRDAGLSISDHAPVTIDLDRAPHDPGR
jgi:exodeoxyribonuclease-3